MLNANQNLMRAAQTAGNIIYTNIVGEPELAWELEDALSMPLSPRAAATAALVLAYTLARTRSGSRKHRDAILRHWENINDPGSDLRFIPATPLALRLLHAIPGKAGEKALHILDEAIRRLENPARAADLLQKLAEDRKQMGVYHTLPASADLMAHLAVPQDDRWGDPQKAGEFRMADYACGAGELLTAAYRRVRELHKGGGGNPREIHDRMMAQGITAVDLLPASVAIAATELEMLEPIPRGGPGSIRAFTLRQGPIVETTPGENHPPGEDRPVGLGSLDLLEPKEVQRQKPRPIGRGTDHRMETEFPHHSQDLVVMNPPYSKPPPAEEMDRNVPNPTGGVQPTTTREIQEMKQRMARIRDSIQAGTSNGLALHFSHLADRMVRPGGVIALLLPMSVVTSHSTDMSHQEGWSMFRRKLVEDYTDIRIVGIAGFEESNSNFSHDTGIAEIMLIARRIQDGEQPDRTGCFINLRQRPESRREAAQLARAIREMAAELEAEPPGGKRQIVVNGRTEGVAVRMELQEQKVWSMSRVLDPSLVEAAEDLRRGWLHTTTGSPPVNIPTRSLGEMASIGTPTPNIEGNLGPERAGRKPLWVLQKHDCTVQRALEVQPLERMWPRIGKKAGEKRLKGTMSRLHLNDNHRYNAQPLSACMTPEPSVGGQGWPNIVPEDPGWEKALAVWLNTSLALIIHWCQSNRTQNGLGYMNRQQMKELPALDVTTLTHRQLEQMEKIFERVRELPMLPANEAWRDPIRTEVDHQVLVEVLELGEEAFNQARNLCQRWCLEPTVQGGKGGVIRRQEDMNQLSKMVEESEVVESNSREYAEKNGATPHHNRSREGRPPPQETMSAVAAAIQIKERAGTTTATTAAEPTEPPTLPQAPTKTPTAPQAPVTKIHLLQELSAIFNFQVHTVRKTAGQPREYNIRTEHGPVEIGPVANIISQERFRDIMADAIHRVVPEQKPARSWDRVAEKILQASVEARWEKPAAVRGSAQK